MATGENGLGARRGSRWTLAMWAGAAAILLAPAAAMQTSTEVQWSALDFVTMGAMLIIACGTVEVVVRLNPSPAYRIGAMLAVAGVFLVSWVNLAVGIVGSEHSAANLLFFAALLVGMIGAAAARFQPQGMARAMGATAIALLVAFLAAVTLPSDEPGVSHWVEFLGTGLFAAVFLGSGWCFRVAAKGAAAGD